MSRKLYQVWDPDEEDRMDVVGIMAIDSEEAAREWAHRSDSECDYRILKGNEVVVCVSLDGSEEIETFRITGEMMPEYWVSKEAK